MKIAFEKEELAKITVQRKEATGPHYPTCGKPGHYARDCRTGNRNNSEKGFLATAFGAKVIKTGWVMDSAATSHMCSTAVQLKDPHPSDENGEVYDGSVLKTTNIGPVNLGTRFGQIPI